MRRAGRQPVLILDAASAQCTPQERWAELFGSAAPKRPDGLVSQVVAWHEQALVHGDVPAHIRRDLNIALAQVRASRKQRAAAPAAFDELAHKSDLHAPCTDFRGAAAPSTKPAPALSTAPEPAPQLNALRMKTEVHLPTASSQLLIGTRLIKAHGGSTHVVEVTAEGMLYQGKLFGSLSAVAKRITGTHWNGLLFFGLRKRKPYDRKKSNG